MHTPGMRALKTISDTRSQVCFMFDRSLGRVMGMSIMPALGVRLDPASAFLGTWEFEETL